MRIFQLIKYIKCDILVHVCHNWCTIMHVNVMHLSYHIFHDFVKVLGADVDARKQEVNELLNLKSEIVSNMTVAGMLSAIGSRYQNLVTIIATKHDTLESSLRCQGLFNDTYQLCLESIHSEQQSLKKLTNMCGDGFEMNRLKIEVSWTCGL
jgi:ribosomal protein S17E